jgi:hypothetical protein
MIKALTVIQPWAWAIMHAGKTIENRSWYTHYRGPLAIHASAALSRPRHDEMMQYAHEKYRIPWKDLPAYEDLPLGAVVGIVDLVDCVESSRSKWFGGPYGFVLANPRPIKPMQCKGALSYWPVPANIERKLRPLL